MTDEQNRRPIYRKTQQQRPWSHLHDAFDGGIRFQRHVDEAGRWRPVAVSGDFEQVTFLEPAHM